jgi:hypothetical protein
MFIVSPNGGLCNQLQTIIKCMLLGMKYNRNIYIDKFHIDYKKNDFVDINCILNIEKMNKFLINNNILNFKIIDKIDITDFSNFKLSSLDYNILPSMDYINNHIEENLDKNIIYLGNIVSLETYKSFGYIWTDYNNFYHFFMRNIIFQDIFYTLKETIKTNLNLTNYTCAHLRIEDDCILYFSSYYKLNVDEYNNKLLSFYTDKIKNITNNIYICSGILYFDNKINYNYYQNLKNDNNLICDKQNIDIDNYYSSNRELIAIVDLLIAYDSISFIGNNISSFSLAINNYFKYKECKTELFNINLN